MQSTIRETLAGNQAFDKFNLYNTLDIPFFTEAARQKFAADMARIFIEDYEWRLHNPTEVEDSVIVQIRKEMDSLNETGLSGRVKDLSAFISQRMEQGSQFLDTHIADLNFYTKYVCDQIEGLMTEIEEPWNVLHDCEWAMSDLDAVYAIYQRIQGYRKNAAS